MSRLKCADPAVRLCIFVRIHTPQRFINDLKKIGISFEYMDEYRDHTCFFMH